LKRAAAALALLIALPLAAAGHVTAEDLTEIRGVLDAQEKAWNRGDLRGYMNGYARGADTTFVSGDSIIRGWQTVLDRYTKKYDTRAKMGTLAYSDVALLPLGGDDVFVTGAWALARQPDNPHGRFTLLVRRVGKQWRIVYDHSS